MVNHLQVAGAHGLIEAGAHHLVSVIRRENLGTPLVFMVDGLREGIYAGTMANSRLRWMNVLMAKVCREHDCHFIDLTHPFKTHFAESGERFNSDVDWHWNEVGHRVAADALRDELAEVGVLDVVRVASR